MKPTKICRKCGNKNSIVYDNSRIKNGCTVRRRKCPKCGWKWQTIEADYWEFMQSKEGESDAELF